MDWTCKKTLGTDKHSAYHTLKNAIDCRRKFMSAIRPYQNKSPKLAEGVFIDESAVVIGDVEIGTDSSVWPCSVIRGDMHFIRIGKRTSIQDGSVLHITHASDYNPQGHPLIIGDDVTVGHSVCLHGCTIGNRVLVGIGSTILDGAIIEDEVVIGAGSLVPPGKRLESGFLYIGSPVKQMRPLKDSEKSFFTYSANNYVKLKNTYLNHSFG
jgi:carbonic anhydrase/acetyltransferase-like protein (isoleucine patch superfamily)